MFTVNYIDECDWIEYDVEIAEAGAHHVQFNVSTPHGNSILQIKCGEDILCTIENPCTGGWKNWQLVTALINISAGLHTLQLFAIGNGFNINEITINPISVAQMSNVDLL